MKRKHQTSEGKNVPRNLIKVIITGALHLICHGAAADGNLLKNPGFEELKDGAPTDWNVSGMDWYAEPKSAGLSAAAADESVFQGAGRRSVRFDGGGRRGLIRQTLKYDPAWGEKLRLSGWLRHSDIPGNLCLIEAEFIGGDGKWLGAAGIPGDWRKRQTEGWEFLQREIKTTEGTERIFINCRTSKPNSGSVWFDNLALERAEPASPAPAPAPGRASVEALIPLDDRWEGRSWGDSGPAVIEQVKNEGADGKLLRVSFPKSTASEAGRAWDYSGEWTGLAFKIRRAAGSGKVSVHYNCGAADFTAAELNPGKDWETVSIPHSQVKYGWGAKIESDKIFASSKVKRIRLAHGSETAVDLADVGFDVPEGLALRSARTDSEANLISPGAKITLKMEMFNSGKTVQKASLKTELRGPDGKITRPETIPLSFNPRVYVTEEINIPPLTPGYHTARIELSQDGRIISERTVGICVLPPPDKDPKHFMGASGFGMGAPGAETGRKLGVQSAEFLVSWADCEPKRGSLRLESFEKTLDIYEKCGFETTGMIRLYPEDVPKWAGALPPAGERGKYFARDPADFGRFMEALVGKYKNRVHRWSFCCEVDLSVNNWAEGFDGYIAMTKAGYEGAKRADPGCVVGGIGVSGCDCPNLPVARKLWASLGNHLDGLFIDAYSDPHCFGKDLPVAGPEAHDLLTYQNAAEIIGAPKSGKRLAVEEKGWGIDNGLPVDHPLAWSMADVTARSFIIARASGLLDHYMHFQLCSGWLEGKYNYSLFRFEDGLPNPRPVAAAYAATAKFLAGVEEPRKLALHKDLYIYIFKHGGGSRAALWTVLPNPVPVGLPLPNGSLLSGAFFNEIERGAGKERNVPLSGSPLFLFCEKLSPADLERELSRTSFKLPCAKLAVSMPDTSSVKIHLKSLTDEQAGGPLSLSLPEGWTVSPANTRVSLPPGGDITAHFKIKSPSAAPGAPAAISAVFAPSGQTPVRKDIELTLHKTAKIKKSPGADGGLSWFKDMPPIKLDDQSFVLPTDAAPNKLWTGADDLSAEVWTAWDEQCFYFTAKVRDDVFMSEKTGSALWSGDAIQLGFDPYNNAAGAEFSGQAGYGGDGREFGIALTPLGPQTYQWIGSPDGVGRLLPDVKLAVKREGNFTFYEWALPWSLLGREPKSGMIFKFNMAILDVDKPGGSPKCWLGLTGGICGGKNPSIFPTFVLTE
jgi:hypothetical protein